MKVVDIVIFIACAVAIGYSFYMLTQLDNVYDKCKADMNRILNESGYLDNDRMLIVPIDMGDVNGNQSSYKDP